jgi:hypothetical protein
MARQTCREVHGDGAEQPQDDDIIHPSPTEKDRGSDIGSDC